MKDKDSEFLDTEKYISRIEGNANVHLFINEKFNERLGLDTVVPEKNQLSITDHIISDYTFFYKIRIEDILYLRTSFDKENDLHQYWCKKMYSFLEYRLKTITDRIKKNYSSKKEQVYFIQNVISFFLEQSIEQKDERFLSISLKLLRNTSIAKYGTLNTKTADQYLYNRIVAGTLITKL